MKTRKEMYADLAEICNNTNICHDCLFNHNCPLDERLESLTDEEFLKVYMNAMGKAEKQTSTEKFRTDIDAVDHPSHYGGQIECIDYIKDKLGDGFVPYCIGNVIKYITRYDKKGKPVEDLQKAQKYLGWAIESLGGKTTHDDTIARILKNLDRMIAKPMEMVYDTGLIKSVITMIKMESEEK